MKKLLAVLLVVLGAAGVGVAFLRPAWINRAVPSRWLATGSAPPASSNTSTSTATTPAGSAAAPQSAPAGSTGSAPASETPTLARASSPEPPGANIVLDDNGGNLESITNDYGAGFDGRRLIDGKPDPVWSWSGPAASLPLEIVLSFYKHESALVTAVAVELPADGAGATAASLPKDVEVWTSMKGPDSGFEKVAAASLTPSPSAQTIAFPSIEARFVKVRVASAQGPVSSSAKIDLAEIRVLEAERSGYASLLARNPDLPNWKDSPRHAAQRGIDWLQPAAIKWQKDHACFGCHIQAQALMGLAIAKKNDYVVSDRAMKDLAAYTEGQQQPDGSYIREDGGEPSTQFAAMGLAYWDDLAGAARNPKLISATDWLAAKQKPAGALQYGNLACAGLAVAQGPMMTTANSLVAFDRAFLETHDARYRAAADRALAWIVSTDPVTTQDKVFKVVALARFGGEERKPLIQQIVEQLILEQHPAGGWRECHTPSFPEPNPFSTGQVLYAFKQAGVSTSSSPFIRGVKFLLGTQRADGSWPADSRQFETMGAPHAPSMWAIIGLAGSFGAIKTGGLQVTTEFPPEQAAARRNLEIILDLSGSMKQPLGKSTRIATARAALREVLKKIPDDFNVGLRVYAHRYSARQKETCTDTELVSPIVKLDRNRILSIADRLQPRGETPLVHSILQAPADLKPAGGGSLVVITDGEETCGGDPVKAAQQLKDAGVPLTLNIVGFTLTGQKVEGQLTAFAEATGGHYYGAQDGEQLGRAVSMAALTRFPYRVYDAKGAQVASGVAGPLAEALQPGTYKVVVEAADQQLTEEVNVTVGADVILKVAQRAGRFQLLRQ